MAKVSIGEAIKPSLQVNCLLCNRFMFCKNPNKDPYFACTKFSNDTPEATLNYLRETSAMVELPEISFDDDFVKSGKEIEEVIEQLIASGDTVSPDLRINDKDMPRPKNFLEWSTDSRFMFEEEQPPFAKQVQIATHLLGEWCPHCSDADYFENVPYRHSVDKIRNRVVFLERGRCPECKRTRAELINEGDLNDYSELTVVAGQRSGKSITVTLIESYNTAQWLLTPNIPQTYKLLPSTILMSTYTALTFKQAKDNIWRPLKSIFDNSPWYRQYHKLLQEEGYKLGQELFNSGEDALHYKHRNMILAPMSPSKRTLRGATRRSASIDELGWYPYGQTKSGKDFERLDAKEVYTALRRSLTTVRNAYAKKVRRGAHNIPKSLFMNISSPSATNDMIMTLLRRYENSMKVYAVKYPTWKFNPEFKRSSFDEEYATNAVEAERDFGANPPISVNAWLKDEKVAIKAFGDRRNGLSVTSGRYKTKSSKVLTSANHEIKVDYWPDYGALLCLDAGLSNNSFAFSIIAPQNIPDPEDEDATVGIDVYATGEIIPKTDAPVSFTHVYKNILLPLCNELPIAAIVSDRWQNIKMLQDLEEAAGTDYFEWRLKYNDFKVFREGLYEGKVNLNKLEMEPKEVIGTTLDNYPHCFNNKPSSHLLFQLLTVQDTGNAVVKGDGTDDIYRTIVLGYTALQDKDVLEVIEVYNATEEIDNRGLGAVALGSRGSQQQSPIIGTGGAGIGIKMNVKQASGLGNTGGIGTILSKSGR